MKNKLTKSNITKGNVLLKIFRPDESDADISVSLAAAALARKSHAVQKAQFATEEEYRKEMGRRGMKNRGKKRKRKMA